MENNPVYIAHQKLGFPALSKEIQAQILLRSDYSPIQQLVPEKQYPFPLHLVKQYITLSKTEFKTYLENSNYLTVNQENYLRQPERDGMWIRNKGEGYEVIWQERGQIDETICLNSMADLYEWLCELLYHQFGN